jgi:hypothetical protein
LDNEETLEEITKALAEAYEQALAKALRLKAYEVK